MVFDRLKGQGKEAAGQVEESLGGAAGDKGMQVEGLARRAEGQAQEMYGAVKNRFNDAADAAADVYDQTGEYTRRGSNAVANSVAQYPFSALLLAGALGFLAFLLVGRSA